MQEKFSETLLQLSLLDHHSHMHITQPYIMYLKYPNRKLSLAGN